jgi:hypothetical protein
MAPVLEMKEPAGQALQAEERSFTDKERREIFDILLGRNTAYKFDLRSERGSELLRIISGELSREKDYFRFEYELHQGRGSILAHYYLNGRFEREVGFLTMDDDTMKTADWLLRQLRWPQHNQTVDGTRVRVTEKVFK